jgi:hypothetical protein
MTHDMARARAETNRINDLLVSSRESDKGYGSARQPAYPQPMAQAGESKLPTMVAVPCPKCGASVADASFLPLHLKKRCAAR